VHEDRGRLARRCPQGVVGTALPVDALETGIDLNVTISVRTPPEPPQLWFIGMAREQLRLLFMFHKHVLVIIMDHII
jgi:hypothetical protein